MPQMGPMNWLILFFFFVFSFFLIFCNLYFNSYILLPDILSCDATKLKWYWIW